MFEETDLEMEWKERKAKMDACDDGSTPWAPGQTQPDPYWPDFKALTDRYLGQGYSLAVCEGSIVDNTTAYAFLFYKIGRMNLKEKDAQSG